VFLHASTARAVSVSFYPTTAFLYIARSQVALDVRRALALYDPEGSLYPGRGAGGGGASTGGGGSGGGGGGGAAADTPLTVAPFSASAPLVLPAGSGDGFSLFALLPVDPRSGWAFAGELNKWVGASSARLLGLRTSGGDASGGRSQGKGKDDGDQQGDKGTNAAAAAVMSAMSGTMSVEVRGSPGEVVVLGFVAPITGEVLAVSCTVTETGRLTAGPGGCLAAY